jgi:hypothetical protein
MEIKKGTARREISRDFIIKKRNGNERNKEFYIAHLHPLPSCPVGTSNGARQPTRVRESPGIGCGVAAERRRSEGPRRRIDERGQGGIRDQPAETLKKKMRENNPILGGMGGRVVVIAKKGGGKKKELAE